MVHKGDLPLRNRFPSLRVCLRAAGPTSDARRANSRRTSSHRDEESAVGTARAACSAHNRHQCAERQHKQRRQAVDRAAAAKTSAEAQLTSPNHYNRLAPLLTKHYVTTQQVDQAQTALQVRRTSRTARPLRRRRRRRQWHSRQTVSRGHVQASQSTGRGAVYCGHRGNAVGAACEPRGEVEQAQLNLDWCRVARH